MCMHLKFSKLEAELSALVRFQYSSDIVEEAAVLAPTPAPMCNTYIIFLKAHQHSAACAYKVLPKSFSLEGIMIVFAREDIFFEVRGYCSKYTGETVNSFTEPANTMI